MSLLPTLTPRPPWSPPPHRVERLRLRRKEHTEADWEAKKGVIERLYVNENRKLRDTMAILESKHDFAATEQMYKKRLRKWNFRKRTYRYGEAATATSAPVVTSDTADHIDASVVEVLRTPRAEVSAVSMVQPPSLDHFNLLETILNSVFSWSRAKLDSQHIALDPMARYLANPNQPPMEDSRTMYRTFELVFDLWHHGDGKLAGMAARKGFHVLEYVLTEDHPDLVWHILDTIYDMIDKGHIQLLGMFLEYTTTRVTRQLQAQHPLFRILLQLKKCDFQTDQGRQHICFLLRQAWLRNVDMLGSHIRSFTPQALWLYEQLIWDGRSSLRKSCPLRRMEETMTGALRALDQSIGPSSDHRHSQKLRVKALVLEFTLKDLGDKQASEKIALELLHHTNGSTRSNARFHAYACKMLARIHEERRNWAVAEQNLMVAIRDREAAHGANDDLRVIRDMWVLAAHFRRTGRVGDADRVARDAIERARYYLHRISG